jgi:predicted ATP-grasp superfamily ATP-dependent carboligase
MTRTEHRTVDVNDGPDPAPPAVVIGLDCITGLQTSRLLADRGVPVLGIVADRRHWGARTNACLEVVEAPLSGPALLEALRGLAGRWGGPSVLIPCTDASVHYLSEHREELPDGWILPIGPHEQVSSLMDKAGFAAHAAELGLPVPRTVTIVDRTQAESAADTLTYPCVLKPTAKSPTWLAHTAAKAFRIDDAQQFMSVYDRVAEWAPVLLAQEWVDGPETGLYSCNAYFDDGQPLVTFVARKLRQWPPEIGTSASGEECRNDEVLATTLRLFGSVGWRGLAYLEMKRDQRTGQLMIIEPNVGRPTGRSAIAEAGGVELVLTAYRHALGLPLPEARTQRYGGAKWIDLRRDAQAAVVAARRGGPSLAQWARWLPGSKAHAIWSPKDPAPFLTDMAQATASGIRMAARRMMAGPAAQGGHDPAARSREVVAAQ